MAKHSIESHQVGAATVDRVISHKIYVRCKVRTVHGVVGLTILQKYAGTGPHPADLATEEEGTQP